MLTRITVLIGLSAVCVPAGVLKVLISAEHGVATPARVYLVNEAGELYYPHEVIGYNKTRLDGTAENHFIPPQGRFQMELPSGKYRLTVERGKEYIPIQENVGILSKEQTSITIPLKRWVDLAARGWFSGDMHLHRGLTDLPVLMEAEDLNVAIPITQWKTTANVMEDPELSNFLNRADEEGAIYVSPKRFFNVLNQELESRGSALLASCLRQEKVSLAYPFASYAQAVHQEGGLVDSEKATSLELPALGAVGAVDTIGLVNNHLWRSGSFHEPWGAWPARMLGHYETSCLGYVRAGFDMYSALLNSGIPVTLSAGTASGAHPVPPGWSRVYVHSETPLNARSWFSALRAGRSFVTTGPILFLRVNGHEPGADVITSNFPVQLSVDVEVLSLSPIRSVEVVVNGKVHSLELKPDDQVENSYRGSLSLTTSTAAWVTAQWVESRANGCDAAHTSPVYVRGTGQQIPLQAKDLAALLARVEQTIADMDADAAKNRIVVESDSVRRSTTEYLERARDVYAKKVQ